MWMENNWWRPYSLISLRWVLRGAGEWSGVELHLVWGWCLLNEQRSFAWWILPKSCVCLVNALNIYNFYIFRERRVHGRRVWVQRASLSLFPHRQRRHHLKEMEDHHEWLHPRLWWDMTVSHPDFTRKKCNQAMPIWTRHFSVPWSYRNDMFEWDVIMHLFRVLYNNLLEITTRSYDDWLHSLLIFDLCRLFRYVLECECGYWSNSPTTSSSFPRTANTGGLTS